MALAMAAAFGAAYADDEALRDLTQPQSFVSVGAGVVSGDSKDRSIWGQYNGLRKDDANLLLDFGYVKRDEATGTPLAEAMLFLANGILAIGMGFNTQNFTASSYGMPSVVLKNGMPTDLSALLLASSVPSGLKTGVNAPSVPPTANSRISSPVETDHSFAIFP